MGVVGGWLTKQGERGMRATFRKNVLVDDEGSLASTVPVRDLLRIANTLCVPCVVSAGDEEQFDPVRADQPFVELQCVGVTTTVTVEILRPVALLPSSSVSAAFPLGLWAAVKRTQVSRNSLTSA